MESHNIRMRQARVDLDLAEKALQRFRIAIGGSRQRPQDFKLACGQIADLVSNSRCGLIYNSKKLIVANGLTGFGHCLRTRFHCDSKVAGEVSQFPLLERRAPNYS